MALIVRVDVDRPYGKHPLLRHLLSRVSSDAFLPRMESFGYLRELELILQLLNEHQARSYVFFRRCTLPTGAVRALLDEGPHEIGLHLENSRSFETFLEEKHRLEQHVGRPVLALSKHGSGGARFGRRHFAPYEPEKYIAWARQTAMRAFFGNLENASLRPVPHDGEFVAYPAAFWLEPHWRDMEHFTIDWLLSAARELDIVLLLHPENVLESPSLMADFTRLVAQSETKILEATRS